MGALRTAEGLTLPDDSQHTAVIGRNGSGKTQGAIWHLSRRAFHRMPWVLLNWKREELIRSIPGLKPMALSDKVPRKPGLYSVEPVPERDDEAVADLLWRIWDREHCGVFVDEAYMLPARSAPFQAILTQGRSKRVPTITLTQRPSWVTRFVFSEASVIQLFRLNDARDYKTVREFMPVVAGETLPGPYFSWWYDAIRERGVVLSPVPDRELILERFRQRLGHNRKAF